MKTCKACKEKFTPWNSLQSACGPVCALVVAKAQTEKKAAQAKAQARAETRKELERIKTRSQHTKDAQVAFNAFIRARDAHLPCISCGTTTAGQFHAGHYRTTKAAPELRFDEQNVHKQCAQCNNFDSGNIVEYRIALVRRIGAKSLAQLEGPHEAKKYTVDELKEIKAHYRKMAREIKSKSEAA